MFKRPVLVGLVLFVSGCAVPKKSNPDLKEKIQLQHAFQNGFLEGVKLGYKEGVMDAYENMGHFRKYDDGGDELPRNIQ